MTFEVKKQFSVVSLKGNEIDVPGYAGANQTVHKLLEKDDVALIVIRVEKVKATE